MEVTLTWYELLAAALVGVRRQIEALAKGLPDRHGFDGADGWTKHIEGAAGEAAYAKARNLYWSASVNTFRDGGDVGQIQVRTRSRHSYELIIRPNDNDDDFFVLVTGQAPKFVVRGGIRARDAKRDDWRQNHGGRPPAYFVPHSALRMSRS